MITLDEKINLICKIKNDVIKLTETKHFEEKNAEIMGVPQSVVAWIFYTTSSATGVISIINDVTGNKYYANVNYNKEVKVESVYPYRAGKTVYSYAYVGDKRAALVYRKTRKNYDLDGQNKISFLIKSKGKYWKLSEDIVISK